METFIHLHTFRILLMHQAKNYLHLQLFRERLSEKVHATILKGIVGGFKFTVLWRNLKELVRKAVEMCLQVLKESNKSRFDSYGRQKQCIDHIPYYLSGLLCAHFSDKLSRNSFNCYVCKACQTSDQPPHCLKICWPFCAWSTQKAGFNKFADQ